MKEYLKITSGDKIMYYPEFRLAEITIMPWYDDKVRIDNQIFTIWKAESEDIDSYSTPGLNTEYELVAKITKITELKDYQELLLHSKEIVMRGVRYKEIMSKLKGNQLEKVKLNSITPLKREFEYNDSIWAWNQLDETIKEEELIDPYK